MANSYVEYPDADGTQVTYSIPFEYLAKSHVKASVDGEEVSFSFTSTYVVTFDTAPSGYLLIYRETPSDELINEYTDGSALIDDELNSSFYQALFVAEEAAESAYLALMRDLSDGKYDAGSHGIKNVADPEDDQDAATKGWVTGQYTSGIDASVSAEAAEEAQSASESILASIQAIQSAVETMRDTVLAAQTATATSETNAATSASSALTYKTATESAKDQALAAFANFQDQYLGESDTEPTLDIDGSALDGGELYFDTPTSAMKVYNGTEWVNAYITAEGVLMSASNLSDVPDKATARTNLDVPSTSDVTSSISTALEDYSTSTEVSDLFDTMMSNGDGHIVEQGSDGDNGTYIKFSNGTLICRKTSFYTVANAAATWTYPYPFSVAPVVCVSATAVPGDSTNKFRLAAWANKSATSVNIYSGDTSGDESYTPNVELIAIGNWASI